jgi:hypothetical protein
MRSAAKRNISYLGSAVDSSNDDDDKGPGRVATRSAKHAGREATRYTQVEGQESQHVEKKTVGGGAVPPVPLGNRPAGAVKRPVQQTLLTRNQEGSPSKTHKPAASAASDSTIVPAAETTQAPANPHSTALLQNQPHLHQLQHPTIFQQANVPQALPPPPVAGAAAAGHPPPPHPALHQHQQHDQHWLNQHYQASGTVVPIQQPLSVETSGRMPTATDLALWGANSAGSGFQPNVDPYTFGQTNPLQRQTMAPISSGSSGRLSAFNELIGSEQTQQSVRSEDGSTSYMTPRSNSPHIETLFSQGSDVSTTIPEHILSSCVLFSPGRLTPTEAAQAVFALRKFISHVHFNNP